MSNPIPDELADLKEIATTVGPAWRYWAHEARVERHGNIWRDLARAHQRLTHEAAWQAVMCWLDGPPLYGRARDEQRELRGLLHLLHALGKAGIAPFEKPVLELMVPKCRRDDSSVVKRQAKRRPPGTEEEMPDGLQYRLRQARAIGIVPRWQAVADFVDEVDEERFNRLCRLVHHMRRLGEDRQLRSWLSLNRKDSPKAAAMARSLLHVVDALEIF